MTEAQIRELAWHSSIKRVTAMIDDYSAKWALNGPAKVTADAIVRKIRGMPVPGPAGEQR